MMTDNGIIAGDELKSLVERIKRLEGEKQGIANDIKDATPRPRARASSQK